MSAPAGVWLEPEEPAAPVRGGSRESELRSVHQFITVPTRSCWCHWPTAKAAERCRSDGLRTNCAFRNLRNSRKVRLMARSRFQAGFIDFRAAS